MKVDVIKIFVDVFETVFENLENRLDEHDQKIWNHPDHSTTKIG